MSHKFNKTSLDINRVSLYHPEEKIIVSDELRESIHKKFPHQVFGLPSSSFQQSALSLTYRCRKAVDQDELVEDEPERVEEQENQVSSLSALIKEGNIDMKVEGNSSAQRKVASALLTMVKSELLEKHFLHKGGLEAVLTLVNESEYL
jgi:hypothetical protein